MYLSDGGETASQGSLVVHNGSLLVVTVHTVVMGGSLIALVCVMHFLASGRF